MIFQDDRTDYVDSIKKKLDNALSSRIKNVKNVMPSGSQSTDTALKFVSDIDFLILVRLEENNMEDQFLKETGS